MPTKPLTVSRMGRCFADLGPQLSSRQLKGLGMNMSSIIIDIVRAHGVVMTLLQRSTTVMPLAQLVCPSNQAEPPAD